jgi:hypothetical protein
MRTDIVAKAEGEVRLSPKRGRSEASRNGKGISCDSPSILTDPALDPNSVRLYLILIFLKIYLVGIRYRGVGT